MEWTPTVPGAWPQPPLTSASSSTSTNTTDHEEDRGLLAPAKRLCLGLGLASVAATRSLISTVRSYQQQRRKRTPSPGPAPLANMPAPGPSVLATMATNPAQWSAPTLCRKLLSPFPVLYATVGFTPPTTPSPSLSPQIDSPSARFHAEQAPYESDSDVSSTYDSAWGRFLRPELPGTLHSNASLFAAKGNPLPMPHPHIRVSVSSSSAKSEISTFADNTPPTGKWQHAVVGKTTGLNFRAPSPSNHFVWQSPTPPVSPIFSPLRDLDAALKESSPKSNAHDAETGHRFNTRSMRKALEEAQASRNYDIKPLSKDLEAKVDSALRNGHGNYTAHDLQKVVPPHGEGGIASWLNDESVNGYMSLITAHGNKGLSKSQTPRFHAFNTVFYNNLSSKGYKSVERWAKRAKISGKSLLDVEKIFIPINPNNAHWTLAVVEPTIKHLTHYNSLGSGSDGRRYLHSILLWLKAELGSLFNEHDWVIEGAGQSPEQKNGSDCGVFTVTTAKMIMLGHDPMSYGHADIPTQRRRMVAELVLGELLKNKY